MGLPAGEGIRAPRVGGAPLQGVREVAEAPGAEVSRAVPKEGAAIEARLDPFLPRQGPTGGELDGPETARLPDTPLPTPQVRHPSLLAAEPPKPYGLGLAPGAERPPFLGPGASSAGLQMARRADDPAWGDELGERVVWLIGRRESLAELRLNPPELGSLEIRIRQEKDAASIHILVQSGTAREALESALPRLRELFGEAGLTLQRLDVAERQAGQPGEGDRDGTPGGPPNPSDERSIPGEVSWRPLGQGEGLLDTYA